MNIEVGLAKLFFSREAFYLDLAEALDDRAQLTQRIENLAERAQAEKDVTAPLFALWALRLDGRKFAEVLKGTVPEGDVMIIQAAEEGGSLSEGLRFTVRVIEASKAMTSSLLGASVGFVISGAILVLMLSLYSFYGIAVIEEVVPPDSWPWMGQMLRELARFVTGWGGTTLISAVVLGVVYVWSLRNWTGAIRVQVDKWIPFYRIYRDFNAAMFMVSLGALMRNRVGLNDALEKLQVGASPWMKWHLSKIQHALDYHSDEPGRAFDTGLFSKPMVWRIIDFGQRSKGFAEAIEKVGLKSIDSVVEAVKKSAKGINVLLTVLTGGMLLFIILATLQTVYEAQTTMQQQLNSTTSAVK